MQNISTSEIMEKISNQEYSPKKYPEEIKKPEILKKFSSLKDLRGLSQKQQHEILEIQKKYDEDCEERKRKIKDYRQEQEKLVKEFKTDLSSALGTGFDEVDDLIFSRAWEDGHSSGFSEVILYYEELSGLCNLAISRDREKRNENSFKR